MKRIVAWLVCVFTLVPTVAMATAFYDCEPRPPHLYYVDGIALIALGVLLCFCVFGFRKFMKSKVYWALLVATILLTGAQTYLFISSDNWTVLEDEDSYPTGDGGLYMYFWEMLNCEPEC